MGITFANCRAVSFLCCGNEDELYTEMGARIVIKMAQHAQLYTSNTYVCYSSKESSNIASYYASYSGYYDEHMSIDDVFKAEKSIWSIYSGNGCLDDTLTG